MFDFIGTASAPGVRAVYSVVSFAYPDMLLLNASTAQYVTLGADGNSTKRFEAINRIYQ